MKILAISGSLARMSSNTELLRAAARLCDAEVILFEGLRDIAPFDPDLADDEAPQPVKNFRALIQNADAVLISSPEYARGVSGVLKNALDWTVPTGDLYEKPVAVFNASQVATVAFESLKEILRTAGVKLIDAASITVPLMGKKLDSAGIVADPEIADALRAAMALFVGEIDAINRAKAAAESEN
jgi:chromate reductase